MTSTEAQLPVSGSTAITQPSSGEQPFRFRTVLRLSTFQIGSAMSDILMTSVWNRIMISNLGIAAWPVGLLIALRYFLWPISLWSGYRSDSHPIRGWHRTPYIWLGRLLMVLSFPILGFSLSRLTNDPGDGLGWLLAVICFLFFGLGTLISGSPYLALVRDSAPKEKQGLAISAVETVLIAFFPISAILFGYWLEEYNQSVFWQVIIVTMLVGAFFWFVAVAGVEKRIARKEDSRSESTRFSFRKTFGKIWRDPRTRRFFGFLAITTVAAWAQDNVLEPFGAEVFDMPVGQTTRLNAYWQGTLVIVLVAISIIRRKSRPEEQSGLTKAGLVLMVIGMIILGLSSLWGQLRLLSLGLIFFGAGFGLFTFGGFSLMAAMTTDVEAGAYLSLWTVCILVSRGLGISLGSFLRDIFIALSDSPTLSYALIFVLEAIGLAVGAYLLSSRDVLGFARDAGRFDGDELPAIALDV